MSHQPKGHSIKGIIGNFMEQEERKIQQSEAKIHAEKNGKLQLNIHTKDDQRPKIYAHYQKYIDNATEKAFENIQWSNTESEPLPEQVLQFPIDNNLKIMCIVNILQYPRFITGEIPDNTSFVWEVKTYIVRLNPKIRLLRHSEWQRKQRAILKLLAPAILFGVNPLRPASFALDGNIWKGFVICTPNDLEVITVAVESINAEYEDTIATVNKISEICHSSNDKTESPIKKKRKPVIDKEIKITEIIMLGCPQTRWEYKSCVAEFGIGDDWATLSVIESKEEGKGHATKILKTAKRFYEWQGKRFGGSIALNDRMSRLYKHLGITEYNEEYEQDTKTS